MKKFSLFLLAILAITMAATAQYGRVGYLDSEIIMKSYSGYEELKQVIEEESGKWAQQEKEMIENVQALNAEYEKQRLMLTDEKRKEKEEEILQAEYQVRQFQEQIWGAGGEFQNKQQEILAPTYEIINGIIAEIAERESYDMIIDVVGGMIVYANPDLNITQVVIEELNKKYDEETNK